MVNFKFCFLLVFLVLSGCWTTSDDVKTLYQKYQLHIKVLEKENGRNLYLKGYNRSNKIIEFETVDFWGVYYYIHVGDSVCKDYGETEIRVIKKDTTMTFPLVWRGEVVK